MAAYDPTDLLGTIPAGQVMLMSPDFLEKLKKVIRMSKPLPGPGMLARQKDDGIEIYPGDWGTPVPFPFQVIPGATSSVESTTISLVDGTFGGMTPTLDGTPINALTPPEADYDGGDIFFEISIKPLAENIGTEDSPAWQIQGGQLLSVAVYLGGYGETPSGTDASVDAESGDTTNGTYYRRICTWNGVTLSSQPIMTSLDFSLCAGGISDEGESVGILTVGVASA